MTTQFHPDYLLQEQLNMCSFGSLPPVYSHPYPNSTDAYPDISLANVPDRGMQADIKHFYRKDANDRWQEWAPNNEELDAERSRNAKFALIVRREQDTNSETGLGLQSFTVQSPPLRGLLQEVFEDYPSVNTKLKQITFNRPFWEFFYRWANYEACAKKATDLTLLDHIKLLDSIVKPEILSKVEHRKELEQENAITFDFLWTLFEPDSEVCAGRKDDQSLYQVQNCAYRHLPDGTLTLQVVCRFVDCDGGQCGFRNTTLTIRDFKGTKSISEMSIVPLKLHPERESLIHKLTERGKKFETLRGVKYMSYHGIVTPGDPRRRPQMIENGRVMVDAKLYGQHYPESGILEPLQAKSASSLQLVRHTMHQPLPPGQSSRCRPPRNRSRTTHVTQSIVEETDLADDSIGLKENQYRLCNSKVKGYDLTTKQWVKLHVNSIREIKWNPAAFKRLYLPQDHKEMILAFVESHMSQENSFDDIIEGKGRGMVMLLSGVPGVGKTLTAEAVAEEMKAPLYAMSAGQLGPDVEAVEEALRDVLDICAKWGAVLLMDEADVFLERRQMTDIHRNKLVSIFLRLLEYYQGCMFLTTNRSPSFDPAFKSRIDLHIDYPNLDDAAKKHIWQTFVTPIQFPQNTSTLTDEDLDVLSKLHINGREIKNLVKTGRLLARRKGEDLGMQHLRTVLSVQAAAPTIESVEVVYPPLD